jgi:hypothetical protein
MGHDPTPSSLQPAQSSSKRATAPNIYLINKSREMHHRFQDSPFFVRPSQEVDVVRYNKRPRPLEPDVHVAESIGKTADPRYLPEELFPDKVATLSSTASLKVSEVGEDDTPKRALTLEELAAEEQRKKAGPVTGEEGEEGDLSDTGEVDDEVADYAANYFASDDESDGDGGGDEAVF